MRLSALLRELDKKNIGIVEEQVFKGAHLWVLGDRPRNSGRQYPVDVTDDQDPDLSDVEVDAIRRHFSNQMD